MAPALAAGSSGADAGVSVDTGLAEGTRSISPVGWLGTTVAFTGTAAGATRLTGLGAVPGAAVRPVPVPAGAVERSDTSASGETLTDFTPRDFNSCKCWIVASRSCSYGSDMGKS